MRQLVFEHRLSRYLARRVARGVQRGAVRSRIRQDPHGVVMRVDGTVRSSICLPGEH